MIPICFIKTFGKTKNHQDHTIYYFSGHYCALTVKLTFFHYLGDYNCFKEILWLTEIQVIPSYEETLYTKILISDIYGNLSIQLKTSSFDWSIFLSVGEHVSTGVSAWWFLLCILIFRLVFYVIWVKLFTQVLQLCGSSLLWVLVFWPRTTGSE